MPYSSEREDYVRGEVDSSQKRAIREYQEALGVPAKFLAADTNLGRKAEVFTEIRGQVQCGESIEEKLADQIMENLIQMEEKEAREKGVKYRKDFDGAGGETGMQLLAGLMELYKRTVDSLKSGDIETGIRCLQGLVVRDLDSIMSVTEEMARDSVQERPEVMRSYQDQLRGYRRMVAQALYDLEILKVAKRQSELTA